MTLQLQADDIVIKLYPLLQIFMTSNISGAFEE